MRRRAERARHLLLHSDLPLSAIAAEVGLPELAPPRVDWPAQAEAPSDNTWAWIALGTGGALLAGGGVTGWQAVKKADKLDQIDDDPSIADEDTYDTLRDEGQTYALATDALIVVGGLALGTGLILLLTGDDAPEAPTALAPAPHGFGLSF
jgi:hypothetical protein